MPNVKPWCGSTHLADGLTIVHSAISIWDQLLPFDFVECMAALAGRIFFQASLELFGQTALDIHRCPIVQVTCFGTLQPHVFDRVGFFSFLLSHDSAYSTIFVTTPAPTVRPPSRTANLKPSSIAMGFSPRSHSMVMLSPGMHISAPPVSLMPPVTSVVLK